jgi:hypothetical protein
LEDEAGQKWLETEKNPVDFMKGMMEAAGPVMWQILDDYWGASQDTDVILFPTLAALPAASIAERLKISAGDAIEIFGKKMGVYFHRAALGIDDEPAVEIDEGDLADG